MTIKSKQIIFATRVNDKLCMGLSIDSDGAMFASAPLIEAMQGAMCDLKQDGIFKCNVIAHRGNAKLISFEAYVYADNVAEAEKKLRLKAQEEHFTITRFSVDKTIMEAA